MPGNVFVDLGEDRVRGRIGPIGKVTELHRFLVSSHDFGIDAFLEFILLLLRPLANRDQMCLQALDRVTTRPDFILIFRSIFRGIIAR